MALEVLSENAHPRNPEEEDYKGFGLEEGEEGETIVDMQEDTGPVDEGDFYDNLVFRISEKMLDDIGRDLLEKIDYDKKSREKRDKLYEEGIKRTGLGQEAPGGAQFQGASRVVHPMLTQASVEFEARMIKEIFPASGPVKIQILGDKISKARLAKAQRKKAFFNWQLRHQMIEFRPELEKTGMQSSLSGAAYMRFIWNEQMRRPVVNSCTSDQVLLPFAATSFYTAERITFVDDITDFEYKERVKEGMYRDADLVPPSMAPIQTPVAKAQAKVEGKDDSSQNLDGLRRTFEVNTHLDGVEADMGGEKGSFPYLVYVDETTRKVLAVVRNWEEDDQKFERMHWIVEWPFVPWTGAYPIGFMHMIGSLSGAATGALRALLDSAHVNNLPTAAKLKGAQVGGQSKSLRATETVEIDGGVGADDIRKLMTSVTYNPPSETLVRLLEVVISAGQGMVRTALETLSDNNPNMPVGTMFAQIEQGLVVVSAIIGRMYYSMEMTLRVLNRVNRMYVTDEEIVDETGTVLAKRSDFQGPLDCIPVADPGTPSDAHRHAKIQAVVQRSDIVMQLYNKHNVEKMFLTRMLGMTEEEAKELLVPVPEAMEMNAANENVAMTMGRPVTVFPEQDHLAHMQVLIDYMRSPFFGMLPNVAQVFLPAALNHLKEHVAFWYVTRIYERLSEALQHDVTEYMQIKDPAVKQELDKTIASVSQDVVKDDIKALRDVPKIVGEAMKILQQMTPPPQDPQAQVAAQRNEIQDRKNQTDAAIKKEELAQRAKDSNMRVIEGQGKARSAMQTAAMKEQGAERRDARKQEAENRRVQIKEVAENERTAAEIESREEMNTQDNTTAMTIASAEIESGERVEVSTGKGINPGSNQ